MEKNTRRIQSALTHQLAAIAYSDSPLLDQQRLAIQTCHKAMRLLKTYMLAYSFQTTAEEVHFFKHIKPAFYSQYIYHVNVFNYLMQQPAGTPEIHRTYSARQLDELKTYFDHNRSFYSYYRAGITTLDELYFTRGARHVQLEPEDFEADEQYSTSHDYKLAKIMAHERFQVYLTRELTKLTVDPSLLLEPFKRPNWTGSQTDAIELIYALKASGSVNAGNIDIAELVGIFEYTFQIELKEYYHKFSDITRRKKDVTVFLTKLQNGLLRWIDDKMSL